MGVEPNCGKPTLTQFNLRGEPNCGQSTLTLIKYNDWCEKGVRFVNDLLPDKGHFLEYTDFCNLYQVHPNIIKYYGIVNAIKVNGHVLIQ